MFMKRIGLGWMRFVVSIGRIGQFVFCLSMTKPRLQLQDDGGKQMLVSVHATLLELLRDEQRRAETRCRKVVSESTPLCDRVCRQKNLFLCQIEHRSACLFKFMVSGSFAPLAGRRAC